MGIHDIDDLARKMIVFLETGDPQDGLFGADVFCDLSLPQWRVQTRGLADVVTLRKDGHPGPSTVTRSRVDPTPTGFVFEFEERWEDAAGRWYARELLRADVGDDGIAELAVYCTGDWDRQRRDEHARSVQLLRT
jgi:hypothetical protein